MRAISVLPRRRRKKKKKKKSSAPKRVEGRNRAHLVTLAAVFRGSSLLRSPVLAKSCWADGNSSPCQLIVSQGAKIGVLGSNGSGKSSLMKVLAGSTMSL